MLAACLYALLICMFFKWQCFGFIYCFGYFLIVRRHSLYWLLFILELTGVENVEGSGK